jgi:hypothetical protein
MKTRMNSYFGENCADKLTGENMEFQTLGLNDTEINKVESKLGFWKRQFQSEATAKQKTFDGVFGVVLPALCFLFDPFVFRGSGALLGAYKPFAYLLSYVSIMGLLAFVLWGEKLKWFNGFLVGLFAVGALISTGIGLVLLPFSLFGLMILIGAMGFTPLFTGFVLWRSAVRAFKISRPGLGTKLLVNMMILSAVLSFTIPEIINVKLHQGLKTTILSRFR